MNQIHNWTNTGLIILVGILVLVGGNQSVPNVGDLLGRVGTEFENGLRTSYLQTPSENISNVTVFSTTQRCQIASASDNCEIINYSGVDWIVRPKLWLSGSATNTRASFFVATSSFAFSGSWWEGVATSSLKHAPISLAVSTTSLPFGGIDMSFGTTTNQISLVNPHPDGILIVKNGDRVICGVSRRKHISSDLGYFEVATSASFSYRGNCLFEIVATSTPDSTPTR